MDNLAPTEDNLTDQQYLDQTIPQTRDLENLYL